MHNNGYSSGLPSNEYKISDFLFDPVPVSMPEQPGPKCAKNHSEINI